MAKERLGMTLPENLSEGLEPDLKSPKSDVLSSKISFKGK